MQEVHGYPARARQFFIVLLPILVTQVSLMAPGFFNTVMAGHISKEDLAGIAVGASIFFPIFGAFMGLISGLTPVIAQHYGARQMRAIRSVVQQSFYWATLLAVLILGLGVLIVPSFVYALALEPVVEDITMEYLSYISCGLIPVAPAVVLRNLIDAHGRTHLTMYITIATIPINIVLNYIFMYGALGMPAFGGAGAGLGAALSYGVFLVLNVIVVLSIKQFARYHVLRRLPKPILRDWWKLLKICIPIGLTIFCEQSIFGAVGLLMAAYGTTVLAAHQAAMNFTTIVYMLPLSVSMAITILVGFEVGGGRENGARAYIRLSRVLTLVFVGAIALVLAAMRDTVAALYTTNAEVQELLRVFLLYALIMQFCDCVNAPLQGALRGYKDVTVTFWLAVLSFWGIGLPSGYVLAGWTALGPYGYWVGLNGGIIVGAVLLMIRLRIIEQRMRRTAYSIS
ncbi:MAG: MATE family efflux transporter [Centipeda sp. (in: firmicutes)]